MASDPTLYVLTGPTAVGKTAAALAWAEAHRAEVLSADASLVYRGLDIGTAKPTAAEQARVRHHGLDLVGPEEAFSVGRWVTAAQTAVAEMEARGKRILVTGGTGLYLQACFGPVTDGLPVPDAVRAGVVALEAAEGLPGLLAALRALHQNPEVELTGIDLRNPRRVAAALARCRASGRTVPELAAIYAAAPSPLGRRPVQVVVLERSREELAHRIATRTEAMLASGLIDEVRHLTPALRANPVAARAIGYREVLAMLDREPGAATTPAELAESINAHTRQLVRRQQTWFRHRLPPSTQLVPADAPLPFAVTG